MFKLEELSLRVAMPAKLYRRFQEVCEEKLASPQEIIRGCIRDIIAKHEQRRLSASNDNGLEPKRGVGRPTDDDLTRRGKKALSNIRNCWPSTRENLRDRWEKEIGLMYAQVEREAQNKNWQFIIDFWEKNPLPVGRGYWGREWDGN